MVVTYKFAGDDEAEKFLLGAREMADDQRRTSRSTRRSRRSAPRSSAPRKGETVDYEAPNGKTLKVEIVDAVPLHRLTAPSPARRSAPR